MCSCAKWKMEVFNVGLYEGYCKGKCVVLKNDDQMGLRRWDVDCKGVVGNYLVYKHFRLKTQYCTVNNERDTHWR